MKKSIYTVDQIDALLSGKGLAILGRYDSTDEITDPVEGGHYYIGTAEPYDVYTYVNGAWVNAGPLAIEGPPGPAFTYDDFTPEQLEALRGPAGPKGEPGAGFKVLGYFASESALKSGVNNPQVGDAYSVGTSTPYDIYIYDPDSGWVNNGPLRGPKGDAGPMGDRGLSIYYSSQAFDSLDAPEPGEEFYPLRVDVTYVDTNGVNVRVGDLVLDPDGTIMSVEMINYGSCYGNGLISIKGPAGASGATGATGRDGYTPVRGTDYWTDEDQSEILNDCDAHIVDEVAKRGQLKPEFAESVDWLKENGDQSKMYVLPDGFIYAYMLTEVETGPSYTNVLPLAINSDGTPYVGTKGEKGYKTGCRLSSSAVEKEAEGRCCTGFIAAKPSDTIRIKNMYHPTDNNMNGYLVIYGSDFVKIASGYESVAFQFVNGECEFVVNNVSLASGSPKNMAYFRISTGIIDDTSIITINQPITEGGTTTGYAWANTGRAFVPADYEGRIVALENDVDALKETVENMSKDEEVDKIALIKAWDAPIYDANIPVFQLSAEKAAMTNAAQTPADIYARYDALMAKHPNYITKTDLGLCSDGVNHVYRYDFREPDSRHTIGYDWSETKTKAIIVSGIHYEWSGIYGLYYALEEIAENPELFNFRRNSHLIVVPCMNPYATIVDNYQSGLATPNSYGVRNANGVEIHRNFEIGWALTEAGTTHYGGAEPLSEVETQYVDTIMKENTDAALFLTCHSFADTSFNFIWPSVATKYMCNMGYRLIDKLSNAWMKTHGTALIGLEDYREDDIPAWDNRLGFAHISQTPGTETRQGTKYGIQSANVEICGRFWTHGTTEHPEPSMSSFTMSRGAEVYINFLLTVFGVYDHRDKAEYGG